jgi:hypothetical protein
MKKNLQMPLKKQWFEMTDTPNGKIEDYREINEYWCKRFINLHKEDMNHLEYCKYILGNKNREYYADNISFKVFSKNIMTLGYPKSTDKERIKIFEHAGIEIGYGKPEWGAEPNKLYFIIKHGKRLQ